MEKEIKSGDGRYYIRRLLPYRTQDNRIDGVVITFSDVTDLHRVGEEIAQARDQLEHRVEARTSELEAVNEALRSEIADRTRVEQELRVIANRLEAVMATAIDAIITIDNHGTVETFNAAAEQIFGYPADRVIGRNVSILMGEPYRTQHDQYIRQYLDTGVAKIIGQGREVVGRHESGRAVPIELSVTEFRVGKQTHFAGILRDISERKAAEDALNHSEQRFRALVDESPQGILLHDQWRPVFANRAVCELFGYESPEALLQIPSLEIHLEAADHQALQQHSQSVMAAEPDALQLPLRLNLHPRQGPMLEIEIISRPIVWNGARLQQSLILRR